MSIETPPRRTQERKVHLHDEKRAKNFTVCGLFGRYVDYTETDDPKLVTCGHCRKWIKRWSDANQDH